MEEMPNNTLFVTGTDTSVGKTHVCANLLEFLKSRNMQAGYQKWVATGVGAGLPEDVNLCLDAAGIATSSELVGQMAPYCFRFPASPHLAAEMEDRVVEPEVIVENYQKLAAKYKWLIVEGVGGIMVPLRRNLLLADLLARLQPRTLVVSRSGLGTLNHTLLTLEALRKRNIPVLGIVFSDPEIQEDEGLVQDNMRTIEEIGLVRVFGRLQRHQDIEKSRAAFIPVGQAILEQLTDSVK
jgi:dethiobiotin synthetase